MSSNPTWKIYRPGCAASHWHAVPAAEQSKRRATRLAMTPRTSFGNLPLQALIVSLSFRGFDTPRRPAHLLPGAHAPT
jgi:hypothetical protein